jgi:hypothetical protein
MLKITNKDKAMLASYARSLVGALMAVYSTGATDPADYAKGAIAAIIPPIMRWVNKNDQAFRSWQQPKLSPTHGLTRARLTASQKHVEPAWTNGLSKQSPHQTTR